MFKKLKVGYVRSFVFGVEDSLVSTVGLLSGVASAGADKSFILLSGVVLIFVEAFSMATGSFLSDQSAEEFRSQKDLPIKKSFGSALIMFFSYFVTGFIPLFPYIIFSGSQALFTSITLSLIALFVLGVAGSSISKVNKLKGGLQMSLIGGIAIIIAVLVGNVVSL